MSVLLRFVFFDLEEVSARTDEQTDGQESYCGLSGQ